MKYKRKFQIALRKNGSHDSTAHFLRCPSAKAPENASALRRSLLLLPVFPYTFRGATLSLRASIYINFEITPCPLYTQSPAIVKTFFDHFKALRRGSAVISFFAYIFLKEKCTVYSFRQNVTRVEKIRQTSLLFDTRGDRIYTVSLYIGLDIM